MAPNSGTELTAACDPDPDQPASDPAAAQAVGGRTARPEATEVEVRLTASYVAAVFSGLALILASVSLGLSLRPRSTVAAPPSAAVPSAHCPASAHLPATVNDHGAAPVAAANLAVEAGDFFFNPTCGIAVTANSTVMLVVHNSGQALHNVSVPDEGIDTDVAPGQTITVPVKVGVPGQTYTYFCKYHRTSGMVGALITASG